MFPLQERPGFNIKTNVTTFISDSFKARSHSQTYCIKTKEKLAINISYQPTFCSVRNFTERKDPKNIGNNAIKTKLAYATSIPSGVAGTLLVAFLAVSFTAVERFATVSFTNDSAILTSFVWWRTNRSRRPCARGPSPVLFPMKWIHVHVEQEDFQLHRIFFSFHSHLTKIILYLSCEIVLLINSHKWHAERDLWTSRQSWSLTYKTNSKHRCLVFQPFASEKGARSFILFNPQRKLNSNKTHANICFCLNINLSASSFHSKEGILIF